ncbi:AbrB family transcriptional regulator [Rhizobium sp. PP-CC-2G-626]|nr:AbrB family transcriptional regulator [Rhizobium sp. PP-CC-2G-626]
MRLKVSDDGRIVLNRDVLEPLGLGPGDEVDVNVMPRHRTSLHVVSKTRAVESLFGMFSHKADRPHTSEEIKEAIAAGYAGEIGRGEPKP